MILIQNAHIKPIVGPELPNGCLLAEDGRITAVAPHIDAPEGCTVIDAGGRLLTPGCVEAHCHIGLDNECLRWEGMDYNEIVDPLTPQLRGHRLHQSSGRCLPQRPAGRCHHRLHRPRQRQRGGRHLHGAEAGR